MGCDQPFVYGNELHYEYLRSKSYSFLQTLRRSNAYKLSSRVRVASESLNFLNFDDGVDGEAHTHACAHTHTIHICEKASFQIWSSYMHILEEVKVHWPDDKCLPLIMHVVGLHIALHQFKNEATTYSCWWQRQSRIWMPILKPVWFGMLHMLILIIDNTPSMWNSWELWKKL